jgi:DNA-binding NarL/FixJ family response regulator
MEVTRPRIRILVVDNHPVVQKGLAATLDPEPDMEVVAFAGSGPEAVQLFRRNRPDITLMDVSLTPEMNGFEAIREIRSEFQDARIIVLSVHDGDEDVHQAFNAGAVTYLVKETPSVELVRIIREVHSGARPIPERIAGKLAEHLNLKSLTVREVEVLRLMAHGLRNKEIGEVLRISETTAQGHVKSILAKLDVHDRTKAVMIAVHRGIIWPE